MTPASFEMDNYMPDWTENFNFDAFLNLSSYDVDQGGEDGLGAVESPLDSNLLDPNSRTLSSAAWVTGPSGDAFDFMSAVCDQRRTDVPGSSCLSTLPGSYESSEARQSPNSQFGTNSVSLGIGHGGDNPYGDAAGPSGTLRPPYASVLETAGSEVMAIGDCGDACTVVPTPEPSRSFSPDLPNGSSSRKDCACISCCGIAQEQWSSALFAKGVFKCRYPCCTTTIGFGTDATKFYEHERSHYGQPGKYTCLEQDCPVVTKNFGDLKRHDKAKHCINPNKEQYPCPVLWCKYSGNNGFARKDKLKSHYRNIHEGKSGPAKANRVIKPATLRPKVSGLEGRASKQKE